MLNLKNRIYSLYLAVSFKIIVPNATLYFDKFICHRFSRKSGFIRIIVIEKHKKISPKTIHKKPNNLPTPRIR